MIGNIVHTPGPWRVVATQAHPTNENEAVTFIQTPILCYDLCFVKGVIEEDQHQANANLIAAAPEMLEALKVASEFISRSVFQNYQGRDTALKAVRQALTKAGHV